MINIDELQRLIDEEYAGSFWCAEEEERTEFLETLDALGYRWASGNKLLSLTRDDYMVDYDGHHGICYHLDRDDKSVTKSRTHHGIEVGSLITGDATVNIDQSAILTMLFETEVTA